MKVEVYKKTTDDWCPSLASQYADLNFVRVAFLKLETYDKYHAEQWRVCCWGEDDFGMERDYDSESEAWTTFLQILGWEDVTVKRLMDELGFRGA